MLLHKSLPPSHRLRVAPLKAIALRVQKQRHSIDQGSTSGSWTHGQAQLTWMKDHHRRSYRILGQTLGLLTIQPNEPTPRSQPNLLFPRAKYQMRKTGSNTSAPRSVPNHFPEPMSPKASRRGYPVDRFKQTRFALPIVPVQHIRGSAGLHVH